MPVYMHIIGTLVSAGTVVAQGIILIELLKMNGRLKKDGKEMVNKYRKEQTHPEELPEWVDEWIDNYMATSRPCNRQ